MKNKIFTLVLIGFLGVFMAPAIFANSQGQDHRAYLEFKPLHATDVEIVKKASLTKAQTPKGKPADLPKKPSKDEEPTDYATGIVGDEVLGNRYAIIIGISDYPGTANDLNYTDDDALAMRDVLVKEYNFVDQNIYLLTDGDVAINNSDVVDEDPTAQNIYDAVNEVKGLALSADDEVVFFFSGHGGKGKADDGDSETIDESIISHDGINLVHIWDGELKILFDEYATDRIIFFFDSCVSGGMTDLAGEGRIVNMATQEKRFDTAVELESLGYGEFTYYFVVEGMGLGYADTNPRDEYVTVEEAFDYAKANVAIDHPTISDGFTDDLPL